MTGAAVSTRVLVLTSELVGPRMAGQAMRMWEISRVLAQRCEVVLLAAHVAAVQTPQFQLQSWSPQRMAARRRWADVVVLTEGTFRVYPQVARWRQPLAIDLACPSISESLELERQWEPPDWWQQTLRFTLARRDRLAPLERGDYFFCGTPRQRDFFLGLLAALGRINQFTYADDLELRRLIDVIPFGVPARPPQRLRPALRGVVPGISDGDFLILWAGGVWAWFDPWTLLQAMALLADELPRAKLYFLGVTPPHPQLNWFAFNDRLIEQSRQLGVLDRNVFINTQWVDYDERENYLLDADVGVTTQAAHLETHLAVRTRAFDYLWAGLPLLVTRGDFMAELVEQKGLGLVVPPGDVHALAQAIRRLAEDGVLRQQMRERVAREAAELTWERVLQPLLEFCQAPRRAADQPFRRKFAHKPRWWIDAHYRWGILRRKGFAEFMRSFRMLMPLRRIRVAFRDEGFSAGLKALWREVRS
jgi:hypothetical protein